MSDLVTGKKIYHGWWIVVTCFMLMALAFTPCVNMTGLFIKPVSETLGISRTLFSSHITVNTIVTVVTSLVAGRILSKGNIRWWLLACNGIMAASFLGYSQGTRIEHFYIASALNGFATVMMTIVPCSILITSWFGPRMRGKAMGFTMMGSGFTNMLLSPIVSDINAGAPEGWRTSFELLALLGIVVLTPLIYFTVRPTPSAMGLAKLGEDPALAADDSRLAGFATSQAMKTWFYWLLILSFVFCAIVSNLHAVNVASYYTDIGLTQTESGWLIALASAAMIVGKYFAGFWCDKYGVRKGLAIIMILQAAGMAGIMLMAVYGFFAIPSALVFGFANSVSTVGAPLVGAEILGNRDFGTLYGFAQIGRYIARVVCSLLGALSYDQLGSYQPVWLLILVTALASIPLTYAIYHLAKQKARELGIVHSLLLEETSQTP